MSTLLIYTTVLEKVAIIWSHVFDCNNLYYNY